MSESGFIYEDGVRCDLTFQLFTRSIHDENTFRYVRKNFLTLFRWRIDRNDTELIQIILDSGKFITAENIGRLIQYAITAQKHEIQIMLTDYKYKHFEFQNPADRMKL